jgi:hypothetical protein
MVLDGEHEYALAAGPVDDVERKARHSTLAFIASRWRTDIGTLTDRRAHFFDDTQESEAEAFPALFIKPGSLNHLVGCCAVEINGLHRRASRAR